MRIAVRAPGKVVICGEYAVLDGAPAICMAVDKLARVSITRSIEKHHTVTAPGYATGTARFDADDGRLVRAHGSSAFGIVEQAWSAMELRSPRKLALTLDTRDFFDEATGSKFGIGSSAALMVALVAALETATGAGTDIAATALAAHRRWQGTFGSGVDVACSFHGGVIAYRVDQQHDELQWPAGLAFAILWSGKSASTGARLKQLGNAEPRPSRKALAESARRMADAWANGPVHVLLDELRAYARALRQFSVDHDLDIFDAGHAGLAAAAGDDVVYKPCGAGGGDIGIALATDKSALAAFIEQAAASGFSHLDMGMSSRGVLRTREEH